MAKKKEVESIPSGSTRALRSRTPTTGEKKAEEKDKGKMPMKADGKAKGKTPMKADEKAKGKKPMKADEKAKGKMSMKADEKAKGKRTVASEKLVVGNDGKTELARKRKVMADEGNTEAAGSQVKKVKAMNKNDKDKHAASGSSRVLRSSSAKKSDGVVKESVKKQPAKGKGHKDGSTSSAGKGSTQKSRAGSATRGQAGLQKDKGKKILERKEAEGETDCDEDILISVPKEEPALTIGSPKPKKNLPVKKEVPVTFGSPNPKKNLPAKKEVPLTIGSRKPVENLPAESSKRTTRQSGKSKDALSRGHAEDTMPVASSSRMVPKQVSKTQNKRGGVQASIPARKNPMRKGRADFKTNK